MVADLLVVMVVLSVVVSVVAIVVVCVDFLGILMAFKCKLELSYVHPERLVQIACDFTNHVHDYIGKGHMLAKVFRGANGDPLKCCTISKPIKGIR